MIRIIHYIHDNGKEIVWIGDEDEVAETPPGYEIEDNRIYDIDLHAVFPINNFFQKLN